MKKILMLILLTTVVFFAVAKSNSNEKISYKKGTYSASAKGFGGVFTLDVTFDNTKILNIKVKDSKETPSIGGKAFETLINAVLKSQNLEVDGVSGATKTSKGFFKAMEKAITEATSEIKTPTIKKEGKNSEVDRVSGATKKQ